MKNDFINQILCGDALSKLQELPSATVNCCVTSPPYYGLRDYGIDGQLGLEESPQEYINKLVAIFHEVARVLKPDGTCWINIADSYCPTGGKRTYVKENTQKALADYRNNTNIDNRYCMKKAIQSIGVQPKSLALIPERLLIALLEDGWIVRNKIIWHKPNPMPESAKDRCTSSYEHIFFLTRKQQYYFDGQAMREPAVGFNFIAPAGSKGTLSPNTRLRKGNSKTFRGGGAYTSNQTFHNSVETDRASTGNKPNETGLRNKRDVWTVSTTGFQGGHFATFPETLIKPCILAGCPKGGIVLDPFIGSGTTAKVAQQYGRNFIGIELNPEYVAMANKRLENNQLKIPEVG